MPESERKRNTRALFADPKYPHEKRGKFIGYVDNDGNLFTTAGNPSSPLRRGRLFEVPNRAHADRALAAAFG